MGSLTSVLVGMQAGLIPRILQYMFERVPAEQLQPGVPSPSLARRVIMRISMVQIQHEVSICHHTLTS